MLLYALRSLRMVVSTVLTLLVVPLVHFMVEKRHHDEPLPPGWSGEHAKPNDLQGALDAEPEATTDNDSEKEQ